MPTKKEREYYSMGYRDGVRSIQGSVDPVSAILSKRPSRKPKRKLNSWQKFVKANAKKPRFRSMNNTARFNKLGIAYRKTAAYKRNKKK